MLCFNYTESIKHWILANGIDGINREGKKKWVFLFPEDGYNKVKIDKKWCNNMHAVFLQY